MKLVPVLILSYVVAMPACSWPSDAPEPESTEEAPASKIPAPAASAAVTEERYAASHILVSFRGAARAPAAVERTDDEAHQRAIDIWRRLEAGESLEELALRYSDGPSAPRSGRIGVYRAGTMMPVFEEAIAAIAEGEVARPFQSSFGWHVARRDPVVEVHARHILITWKGAVRSGRTRSKEQARLLIEKAQQRLDGGEAFEAVAASMGEDATSPRGGDLGILARGQLIPSFDAVVFALAPGERSAIVETPYGFHLIERLR